MWQVYTIRYNVPNFEGVVLVLTLEKLRLFTTLTVEQSAFEEFSRKVPETLPPSGLAWAIHLGGCNSP